jgi:hypothetical protein
LHHRHALVIGENAVNHVAGLEMTKAGVKFVAGLRRAADVELLDDMRATFQHEHHHAFEFGRQNRLHNDLRLEPGGPGLSRRLLHTEFLMPTIGGVKRHAAACFT